MAGAGLFALAGGGVIAIIDAATFVIGVVSLMLLRVAEPAPGLGRDTREAGLVGPWVVVAATTALQRRTPSGLLGRVSGAFELSLTVPQVTSVGLGAALIAVVDYRILLVTVAVVAVVAGGYLVLTPDTRRPGIPSSAPEVTVAPET